MFGRNKQLEEANQKVDEINTNLKSHNETVDSLKQQLIFLPRY